MVRDGQLYLGGHLRSQALATPNSDVLAAGVEALQERDQLQDDWIANARQRFEQGRGAFERGEVVSSTPDELMDGIERELGID